MGASYISRRINETNKNDVKEIFEEIVEECLREYGHDSYNGTFSTMSGIQILSKVFSDRNSADDYIVQKAEKWGPALAVQVKNDKENYTVIGGWAAQ